MTQQPPNPAMEPSAHYDVWRAAAQRDRYTDGAYSFSFSYSGYLELLCLSRATELIRRPTKRGTGVFDCLVDRL